MEDSESFQQSELKVKLPNRSFQELLYANSDRIIHHIERETSLEIGGRDSHLTLKGTPQEIEEGRIIINNLANMYDEKRNIAEKDVSLVISK